MGDVQHVSISIARQPADVYEFASDPRNLPRWAAGLARSEVRQDGDAWIAPDGVPSMDDEFNGRVGIVVVR